ncbi:hypothetical protein ACIGO9_30080 [Nocardia asteroides]|uniref:hypothetical protein n=1 Tax=Nocardia asteroides TaxID=1824 RepID=UPI0037C78D79
MPWTTFMLHIDDVWWARIDTPRLLQCQARWLCQVCGLALAPKAWVLVDTDGTIISDAALHYDCLTLANRWCPELKRSTYQELEVERHRILADIALDSFDPADTSTDWGTYGDGLRRWTLTSTPDHR